MTWSRVFPILLVMGVISLLLSLTSVLALGDDTIVIIRDGEGTNELSTVATISVHDAEPLAADQVYEGWFISDDGSRKVSTGILEIGADGNIDAIFASADGENLFTDFNQFVITIEPVDDTDLNPSGVIYLSDTLPAGALVWIRDLAYSDNKNPAYGDGFHSGTAKGTAVGLREQAQVAWDNAKAASDAANDGDLAGAYRHSEAVLNVIEGADGTNYGDLNGDGTVNNDLGDGFGVLTYAADAAIEGAAAGSAAPNNSNIVASGLVVTNSAENMETWLGQAVDTIIGQLVAAVDAGNAIAVKGSVEDVLFYTDSALNGRSTGQGGAKQAYAASQDMGSYMLVSPADAPSVGDPAVPQMAMWALILGAGLLAIGGLAFYRSRRPASTA